MPRCLLRAAAACCRSQRSLASLVRPLPSTAVVPPRRQLSALPSRIPVDQHPAAAPGTPSHADLNAHPSTAAILRRDRSVLLQLYARPDVIFSHGQGAYLFDTAGRRFLDLAAGIAVNALGHGDRQIVDLVSDQTGRLVHLSNLYHNEHAGPFAEALVNLLPEGCQGGLQPGTGKVFFCNSGTEANEAAIKFGRKAGRAGTTGLTKTNVVSFSNAFHGRSMGALSATPNAKYQAPFAPLVPGFVNAPYNDVKKAREVIDDSVCAVIVEPVQGEGGIFPATKEFLEAVRQRCDEVGAVLIFDEIQCGLGRTGTLFAYEQYGVSPDIMTLAKPLANGLPIGAVILSPSVASQIKPGDHGTTFGGSPLATRVGHHVLNRISDPAFLSTVKKVGERLRNKCEVLMRGTPLISEVRASGMMVGLQLREGVDPAMFVDLCREYGVLVISAGCNTVRLVPPLVLTEEEVDRAVEVFEEVVGDMESIIAAGKA